MCRWTLWADRRSRVSLATTKQPLSATCGAADGREPHLKVVEMRTVAGPSRVWQCVLSGGPYTVSPHVRHVQVVCPRQAWCPARTWFGPKVCPFGQRVGGCVIHFPAVVRTKSPSTTTSL